MRGYAQFKPDNIEVRVELIIDREQGHYELMYAGWNEPYRVHGSVVHIDIIDGKVWVQHDGLEHGVVNDLIDAGLTPEQIVLAFKAPSMRPDTGFAVA